MKRTPYVSFQGDFTRVNRQSLNLFYTPQSQASTGSSDLSGRRSLELKRFNGARAEESRYVRDYEMECTQSKLHFFVKCQGHSYRSKVKLRLSVQAITFFQLFKLVCRGMQYIVLQFKIYSLYAKSSVIGNLYIMGANPYLHYRFVHFLFLLSLLLKPTFVLKWALATFGLSLRCV